MAYVAGSAFEAGTGTTSGVLLFFIMAMILHPDAKKRAQEEIDEVLQGEDGPPTFVHIKSLPYCMALCKEVFRLQFLNQIFENFTHWDSDGFQLHLEVFPTSPMKRIFTMAIPSTPRLWSFPTFGQCIEMKLNSKTRRVLFPSGSFPMKRLASRQA